MKHITQPIENQGKHLTKRQRRVLKKQRLKEERIRAQRTKKIRKIVLAILISAIIVIIVILIGWLVSKRPNFPPITMQGHTEQSPPSHILDTPMAVTIQKHMLEHADGDATPGIIIQYNCNKFDCEPDLIDKLTKLTKEYPENVYLAPNKYDGKIILTKLNEREVLDEFDDKKIREFIGDFREAEEITDEAPEQEETNTSL